MVLLGKMLFIDSIRLLSDLLWLSDQYIDARNDCEGTLNDFDSINSKFGIFTFKFLDFLRCLMSTSNFSRLPKSSVILQIWLCSHSWRFDGANSADVLEKVRFVVKNQLKMTHFQVDLQNSCAEATTVLGIFLDGVHTMYGCLSDVGTSCQSRKANEKYLCPVCESLKTAKTAHPGKAHLCDKEVFWQRPISKHIRATTLQLRFSCPS